MGVFVPESAKKQQGYVDPRPYAKRYDASTGKWSDVFKDFDKTLDELKEKLNDTTNNKVGDTSNLTSKSGDSRSSLGSVEKKYNTIEMNTLEGQLQYIATKDTIKLKAGDTVKLKGFGKFLSGNYYIKEITRSLSSSGYTNTATVIKTDFGDSLKTKTKVKKTSSKGAKTPNSSKDTAVSNIRKKDKLVLTDDLRKHIAAAIWNGNYGWEPNRDKKLKEVFGANNGIVAIYNKGVKYVAGISPAGYSYSDMKKKYGK